MGWMCSYSPKERPCSISASDSLGMVLMSRLYHLPHHKLASSIALVLLTLPLIDSASAASSVCGMQVLHFALRQSMVAQESSPSGRPDSDGYCTHSPVLHKRLVLHCLAWT